MDNEKGKANLGRTGGLIEKDAVDAPVQDVPWIGQEIDAESMTRLDEDAGTGRPIILRRFDFSANPVAFQNRTPTKQELFDSHAKSIEVFLWKDGLSAIRDMPPRIVISKDKTKYGIFVACQPRVHRGIRATLPERPRTLGELTKKKE